jgi:hypothetical protein
LHQPQHSQGGSWLANRYRLKERVGRYRRPTDLGNAEATRPFDLAVVDYGNTHPWDVEGRHSVDQAGGGGRLAFDQDGGPDYSIRNATNSLLER